jgi:hypothetical protein
MYQLAEFYSWEAEMPDETIISSGGRLDGAVRVSLIPKEGLVLPRHDFVGLSFKSRFIRNFKRSVVGGFDKAKYFAEIERNMTDARREARKARDEAGLKPVEPEVSPPVEQKRDESVHCIETDSARYWIRSTTGGLLVTPPDFELWL